MLAVGGAVWGGAGGPGLGVDSGGRWIVGGGSTQVAGCGGGPGARRAGVT